MVSQWGPNPQGVRSRPSRAVSLRDVREQPVQRMGASPLEWDIDGNLVNPSRPEIQSKNPKWEPAWRDWIDSRIRIGEKFTPDRETAERDWWDRATEDAFKDDPEGQAEFEKDWEPVEQPVTEIVPGYSDPADPAGWFRLVETINAERAKNGQPPLTPEEEMKLRDGLGVEEAPPGEWESVGLSARDRALVQSPLAMAGEGKRPWELTEAEKRANRQREINRRGMEQIRKDQEERERRRTGPDQQTLGLGDPQSQMSQQFLADRFAQQAAQPQQGYFGGLGEAVGGMSTEQKIALLVGLGLLTGGTSTPLMAPALGVGAGLAFTQ